MEHQNIIRTKMKQYLLGADIKKYSAMKMNYEKEGMWLWSYQNLSLLINQSAYV